MEKKQEIPGQDEKFTPEEIKSIREKEVKENIKLISDLNKIKVPLSVTVFKGNRTWSIRNIAFWKAMNDRDDKVVEFMEKYLKSPEK